MFNKIFLHFILFHFSPSSRDPRVKGALCMNDGRKEAKSNRTNSGVIAEP